MSNKNNYIQLKKEIQRCFGRPIQNIGDLKNLHESIEDVTKAKVGFNTLRRFFGFLHETKPSYKTVNLLSNYLGYKNYSSFIKSFNNDEDWANWSKIIQIETAVKVTRENLHWLALQNGSNDYHLKIASIIKSLVYNQKYAAVEQLFTDEILVFSNENLRKFAQNMGFLLSKMPKEKVEKLLGILVQNENFRRCVAHWHVDYLHFNGYYGVLVQKGLPLTIPGGHEELFFELIINYNLILSQKGKPKKVGIDRIKDDFFSVLKGRCFAYNLIYYHLNKEKYSEIWLKMLDFMSNNKSDVFLFAIEIVPTLLLLKEFKKINELVDLFYNELLSTEAWNGYHVHSNVLLAITLESMISGNLKNAEASFKLIQLSKFNTSYLEYNLLFYEIVHYHLVRLNDGTKKELNSIEKSYNQLVKSTGFNFFSRAFLRSYLD